MLFGLVSGTDHICAYSPEGRLPTPVQRGLDTTYLVAVVPAPAWFCSWFVLGSFLWFRGVGCVDCARPPAHAETTEHQKTHGNDDQDKTTATTPGT